MALALILTALAALTGTVAVLGVRGGSWADRGIRLGLPYPALASLQVALALPAGLLVAARFGAAAGVGAAAFTWLAVLATASDLTSMMLPREACHAVTLVGVCCLAVSWSFPAAFSLIAAFLGLVVVPWVGRLLTRRGMGFGDIRLLAAATASLSWWVGWDLLLYGFIAAFALQLLLRVGTWPWRDRIGVREPHATDPTRTRRALPFAPAILTGLTAAAVYVTVTGLGACAAWAGIATCG